MNKPTYEELAAQVETLKDAANFAYRNWRSSSDVIGGMRILVDAVDSTPQQALAEIRAEAGRAGYQLGAEQWCFNQNVMQLDIERAANQYAEQIRQGGA